MLGYMLIVAFAAGVALYFIYPPFREKVKGWRTMATATSVAVLGVLQSFDLSQIVAKEHVGYWLLGIGVTMALLRVATTKPMGR